MNAPPWTQTITGNLSMDVFVGAEDVQEKTTFVAVQRLHTIPHTQIGLYTGVTEFSSLSNTVQRFHGRSQRPSSVTDRRCSEWNTNKRGRLLANLDTGEQDQMRRLLTACIAALTEPPAPAT